MGQLAKQHLLQPIRTQCISNQSTPLVISQIPSVPTLLRFRVSRKVFIATRVPTTPHLTVTAIGSIDDNHNRGLVWGKKRGLAEVRRTLIATWILSWDATRD